MANINMNLHGVISVVAGQPRQSMAMGELYTSRAIIITLQDGSQFELDLFAERADQVAIDEVGK